PFTFTRTVQIPFPRATSTPSDASGKAAVLVSSDTHISSCFRTGRPCWSLTTGFKNQFNGTCTPEAARNIWSLIAISSEKGSVPHSVPDPPFPPPPPPVSVASPDGKNL